MAWVSPRTWTAGETVTAALMNQHVRDNLNALGSKAIVIGMGGSILQAGVQLYVEIPVSMTITGWALVANTSGTLILDVWKDVWANFPPTNADSIVGSEAPALNPGQASKDTDLSSWTTDIVAGDVLAINVDSVATIVQATLTLRGIPA